MISKHDLYPASGYAMMDISLCERKLPFKEKTKYALMLDTSKVTSMHKNHPFLHTDLMIKGFVGLIYQDKDIVADCKLNLPDFNMDNLDADNYVHSIYDELKGMYFEIISMFDIIMMKRADEFKHGGCRFMIQTDELLYSVEMYYPDKDRYIATIHIIGRIKPLHIIKCITFDSSAAYCVSTPFYGPIILNIPGRDKSKDNFFRYTFNYVPLLRELFKCYTTALNESLQPSEYQFNNIEIETIKYGLIAINPLKDKAGALMIPVHDWIRSDEKPSNDIIYNNEMAMCIENVINNKFNLGEYPVMDFNSREFNWIQRYCDNRDNYWKKITPDGKTDMEGTMDLSLVLGKQPYGNRYRLPMSDDITLVDPIGAFTTSGNELLIYFINSSAERNLVHVTQIIYNDIHEWNPAKFNRVCTTYMIDHRHGGKIPSCNSAVSDLIGMNTFDIGDILKLVIYFISILIVMHDRPNKTRHIIEEQTVPVKVTKMVPAKKGKKKQITIMENRVVYRHILRTASGLKRYIKEHEQRTDIRYTIEEWDRIGHWRTLKNGHQIWIEPTTCHRHKPIAKNVDIHIKL